MSGGRADSGRACGWSVLALGLALIAIPVVRWLAAIAEGRPPTATAPEFVLIGGPATVPTVVGWGLLHTDADLDHCRRVARWTAVGVLSLGFLATVLILYPAATVDEPLLALGPAASVGAGAGALVGRSEARAVSRVRAAERARLSAEAADRERETSAFLNALLRHHVLNAMNVVRGYADLSIETASGDNVARLETIRDRSDAVATLVEEVQVLTTHWTTDPALTPIDLSAALDAELTAVATAAPTVTFETRIPADVYVLADDFLATVLGIVLDNAVEHGTTHEDDARSTVTVTATATATATDPDRTDPNPTDHTNPTVVTVVDEGPGVPDDRKESIFERDDRGGRLGLYLARTLVSRYGGTIRVTDNDPTGAVFEISLPTAAPPDGDDACAVSDTDPDIDTSTDTDDGTGTPAPRDDGDGNRTDTGDAGGDSAVDPRLARLRSALDR